MEKTEYEIQHFGFSVEEIKLGRRHVIKQRLKSLLQHSVDSLVKKSNISQENSTKLTELQKEVAEKMFFAFTPTLVDIEKLDDKFFTIPENVLLHQDFRHMKPYTIDNEEKLKNDVENLKKQFLENSVMITAIEAENSKYTEIQSVIQEELKEFQSVQETFAAINIQNTRQMVSGVLSTLEKSNVFLQK